MKHPYILKVIWTIKLVDYILRPIYIIIQHISWMERYTVHTLHDQKCASPWSWYTLVRIIYIREKASTPTRVTITPSLPHKKRKKKGPKVKGTISWREIKIYSARTRGNQISRHIASKRFGCRARAYPSRTDTSRLVDFASRERERETEIETEKKRE